MNEKLKSLIENFKKPKTLIVIGLSGILLIAFSSILPSGKELKANNGNSFDNEEYRKGLEKSIASVVRGITGDKNATVVITLQSGIRYSYADDVKTDSDLTDGEKTTQTRKSSESSHITVKASNGEEKALVVTENMPEIRGVAIICDTGGDEAVEDRIKSAVIAALDVTSKRVYITDKLN